MEVCLLLNSGKVFNKLWELVFPLAQRSILKLMAKLKESIKSLKTCFRACVISFGKNWEKSLPFAEFSYNNSYQSSLGRAPFEVLYGRKCRTPLNWSETGERQFFGPDMIQEAEEQVSIIREHLKTAQSRQKSYYDKRHREDEL